MVNLCDIFLTMFEKINLLGYFLTLDQIDDLRDLSITLFQVVKWLVYTPTKFTHIYFLGIILFSEKRCVFNNLRILFCFVSLFEIFVYQTTKQILRNLLILILEVATILVTYILCYECSRYLIEWISSDDCGEILFNIVLSLDQLLKSK